jgi:hypothetical protein
MNLFWESLFFRHAGLEEPAPEWIRGHPENLERTGCARSLRSLRLPSVARLEFIPMKIGTGMTIYLGILVYGQTLISKKL